MEWFILTHLGGEQALKRELSEHGLLAKTLVGACSVTAKPEEMTRATYHLQTATRILQAVGQGTLKEINPQDAEAFIEENETFRVSTELLPGAPERTAMELSAEFGEHINRDVDLETPDKTVFFYVGTQVLFGIDVAGDLSKRYYRVFSNAHSVKGTLAATILHAFELKGGVLDPFGNTGEVAIEAAMRATKTSPLKYTKHTAISVLEEYRKKIFVDAPQDPAYPVWCFDPKLANLRSAKKNAKLGGVEKAISYSKLDTEWMDVKFGEGEVHNIVTLPPPITKRNPEDDHIKELCYQAEFVLKKGGFLVVACETQDTASALIKHAKTYKLRLRNEVVIYSGNLPYHVMQYEL